MKPNLGKCSAWKVALLFGTITTLLTACSSFRSTDLYAGAHRDQSHFDDPKPDDFEHHQ